MPDQDGQGRSPLLDLLAPHREHRRGADDQRGLVALDLLGLGEQGDGLDRLAEAHVVGEDADHAVLVQLPQPREPGLLVVAQLDREGLGLPGRPGGLLARHVGHELLDVPGDLGVGCGRQQAGERAELEGGDFGVALLVELDRPRGIGELLQLLGIELGDRAIGQGHPAAALVHPAQQIAERDQLRVAVDVDDRLHVEHGAAALDRDTRARRLAADLRELGHPCLPVLGQQRDAGDHELDGGVASGDEGPVGVGPLETRATQCLASSRLAVEVTVEGDGVALGGHREASRLRIGAGDLDRDIAVVGRERDLDLLAVPLDGGEDLGDLPGVAGEGEQVAAGHADGLQLLGQLVHLGGAHSTVHHDGGLLGHGAKHPRRGVEHHEDLGRLGPEEPGGGAGDDAALVHLEDPAARDVLEVGVQLDAGVLLTRLGLDPHHEGLFDEHELADALDRHRALTSEVEQTRQGGILEHVRAVLGLVDLLIEVVLHEPIEGRAAAAGSLLPAGHGGAGVEGLDVPHPATLLDLEPLAATAAELGHPGVLGDCQLATGLVLGPHGQPEGDRVVAHFFPAVDEGRARAVRLEVGPPLGVLDDLDRGAVGHRGGAANAAAHGVAVDDEIRHAAVLEQLLAGIERLGARAGGEGLRLDEREEGFDLAH